MQNTSIKAMAGGRLHDTALKLEGALLSAMEAERCQIAFQPVIDPNRRGTAAFHECLVRFYDDDFEQLPTAECIELAERNGLVRTIDLFVLREAMRTLRDVPELTLSVNMSQRSVGSADWMAEFERGLANAPGIADRMIVEITETAVMQAPHATQAFIAQLQDQGVCVALDDFGVGFTSLSYLRDLSVDMVKIDGSFISGVADDPDNQVLVQAFLDVCNHFEFLTVAECVETAADADWLAAEGLDYLQGHLFGVPELHASAHIDPGSGFPDLHKEVV
jgi:EAL domain-containing protein (putative c-di-GMP-specific phosphodiesterase class I)